MRLVSVILALLWATIAAASDHIDYLPLASQEGRAAIPRGYVCIIRDYPFPVWIDTGEGDEDGMPVRVEHVGPVVELQLRDGRTLLVEGALVPLSERLLVGC